MLGGYGPPLIENGQATLVSILKAQGSQPRTSMVHHSSFGVFAIRSGPWKLIEGTEGSGGWPPPRGKGAEAGSPGQLYNLDEDPAESNNLWQQQPDKVKALLQELENIR